MKFFAEYDYDYIEQFIRETHPELDSLITQIVAKEKRKTAK